MGRAGTVVPAPLAKWTPPVGPLLGLRRRAIGVVGALFAAAFPTRLTLDPQQDIAIVTGGSSGLGAAIARELATRHVRTAVLDIVIPPKDEQLAGVSYFYCDVTSPERLRQVATEVRTQLGGSPTVLINNAAVMRSHGTTWAADPAVVGATIDVNLAAHWKTAHAFLPAMISMRRGYVVTVASTLAFVTPAYLSAYGASKAGVLGMHEALTAELGGHGRPRTGVHTLLVTVGQMDTPLTRHITTPSRIFAPVQSPTSVATLVVDALAAGRVGEINVPLYARFVALLRVLPWQISDVVRAAAGVDSAVRT